MREFAIRETDPILDKYVEVKEKPTGDKYLVFEGEDREIISLKNKDAYNLYMKLKRIYDTPNFK